MTTSEDFDAVIERYHQAAGAFVKGNNETYKALFSQSEDVTVANPFFPATRGWKDVEDRMDRAAARWSEGEVIGFENIIKYVSGDLGYILEIERFHAKIGGSQQAGPIALRVTSILRREDGEWKIVHRHADPITAEQPPESVKQS
jgi:ketosteroid isomerase-like protein